ncbi:mucin-like glycoprotein [Trypanosoma rangeli]|uniref:Mucin-like glycoprotein n=1 Tax=Trypanosoma rangeli TaxID=5698 RepID=A0A3R7N5H9_TRYRA|nr:mucin-like glycoprotein [Trypanosoma rangeli]RNE96840.1 mucin-like glycoprotein [Trypanosoma rangeli]|eukprot:RNE96840.1 mucin-like glycoprotein [Trypanosoma rangeli]
MAMATVRRHAVWALAVLALLCGCCSSVWGVKATVTVGKTPPTLNSQLSVLQHKWQPANVSVEVSCADANEVLHWRFPANESWESCTTAVEKLGYTFVGEAAEAQSYSAIEDVVVVDVSQYGGDAGVGESICLSAASLYMSKKCKAKCGAVTDTASKQTAFTMEFPTHVGSGVHKKWEEARKVPGSASPPLDGAGTGLLGKSGVCPLTDAVEKPAAKADIAPEHSASPPAAEEPAALPVDAAASSKATAGSEESAAHRPSETQTPSTSAPPSKTPPSTPSTPPAPPAPPADGADGGTTTTTTSSPVAGKHTKSKADGSDTTLFMMRTPVLLLLLLMAAVACAAGQW